MILVLAVTEDQIEIIHHLPSYSGDSLNPRNASWVKVLLNNFYFLDDHLNSFTIYPSTCSSLASFRVGAVSAVHFHLYYWITPCLKYPLFKGAWLGEGQLDLDQLPSLQIPF